MADPASWALAIGAVTAAAGAGTAAYSADQNRKAVHRSQDSAKLAAEVQSRQIASAAQLEKQKVANKAQMIRGRIRAAAAAAGFDNAGSYQSLEQQVSTDAALNTQIIGANRRAQLDRVSSGLQADLLGLGSHVTNPILAAFTGGMQGVQAGLAIGGMVDQASRPPPTSDYYGTSTQDQIP